MQTKGSAHLLMFISGFIDIYMKFWWYKHMLKCSRSGDFLSRIQHNKQNIEELGRIFIHDDHVLHDRLHHHGLRDHLDLHHDPCKIN